ncbi:hypothetical protein K435DRAFT_772253 [Dendrothele bispora CBS 962.96]|uniref:Fe2OG dioxygenase domain-containing protein n=1 Tax=Dendrothele bispora (strain CBS 962.96) TaxID=1314807 RepID=A0A4S8MXQ4_DENBC|nr:hypothetical protein K435DRAFT_772253 [Dendrothele bispora CBS 962.96]
MTPNEDTDTLIALVSSQLNLPSNIDAMLEALVQSNGNPQDAAKSLNNQGKINPKKRKQGGGLQSWLDKGKGSKVARREIPEASSSHSTRSDASLEPVLTDSSIPLSPSKPSCSSSKVPSSNKPVVDLMSILRQPEPTSPKKKPPQAPPLTLSNPAMIAQHVPCTLHTSVLPPKLASDLFYTMLARSKTWKRNKWWLFERVVESPHRTSFFARKTDGVSADESWQEAAQFWYNGRPTDPPEVFPPEMENACSIIERVVSEQLRTRQRFGLEWGGGFGAGNEDLLWRANVAASNCYEGRNESVGWHSDQMQYLGPYCTIASLSLGTRRNFSLREVVPAHEAETRRARTFNIPLPHNSLVIMHASCQERFKHSIPPQSSMDVYRPAYPPPTSTLESDAFSNSDSNISTSTLIEPSNCRINITFRFYRPDFRPESIPRCKCGVPMILRADMKQRLRDESDLTAITADAVTNKKEREILRRKEPIKDEDQSKESEGPQGHGSTTTYTYVDRTDKYWWTCYAGAQNDGKGCATWQVMDFEGEGRGPGVFQLPGARCVSQ